MAVWRTAPCIHRRPRHGVLAHELRLAAQLLVTLVVALSCITFLSTTRIPSCVFVHGYHRSKPEFLPVTANFVGIVADFCQLSDRMLPHR